MATMPFCSAHFEAAAQMLEPPSTTTATHFGELFSVSTASKYFNNTAAVNDFSGITAVLTFKRQGQVHVKGIT